MQHDDALLATIASYLTVTTNTEDIPELRTFSFAHTYFVTYEREIEMSDKLRYGVSTKNTKR